MGSSNTPLSQEAASSKGAGISQSTSSGPLKYLGFAILLAWHYCIWFVPNVFPHVALLDDSVTYSWLVNLAATVFSLFVIARIIGRNRYLSEQRWLFFVAPLVLIAGSLYLLFGMTTQSSWVGVFAAAIVLGMAEALLWILWGERFARVKSHFSIKHIGMVFGLTLLVTTLIAMLLPPVIASVFVSLLPLASGGLLLSYRNEKQNTYPVLLSKNTAKGGVRSLIIVCSISFVASMACYFLAAIIPWEELPFLEDSFTFGVIGGALLLLLITGVCIASKNRINVFKLYPWLLVVEVIAFALFLTTQDYYFIAFIFALAISSIFEILLIMYFGILTLRGFIPPVWAFSFSCGVIRLGVLFGNSLAIFYESYPALAVFLTPDTCLVFIAALLILLIFLVKQEYSIAMLTSDPLRTDELKDICAKVAKEFKLSKREQEIMTMMALGHTADSIAKRLVISPYTVNTHIRHIYEKTQIRKRSELLHYINMQASHY
ncbi:MAG: helix-turn-helix transcriptional regulator [Coriobacteriia bacterium]|nr:helix-turn-helix transcriptional regulator [Coriobacteriia bacterium]MCL2750473.1 helix-turn-helix transcriptional regulator [Coriobacteriia bacterium]